MTADEVLAALSGPAIRLARCDYTLHSSTAETDFDLEGATEMGAGLQDDVLTFMSTLELRVLEQTADADLVCELTVSYVASFDVEPGIELTERELEPFGSRVVAAMLWPYIRETVSGLASRSGVPLTIPIVRFGVRPEEIDAVERVDER